jgi:hypothetical protein
MIYYTLDFEQILLEFASQQKSKENFLDFTHQKTHEKFFEFERRQKCNKIFKNLYFKKFCGKNLWISHAGKKTLQNIPSYSISYYKSEKLAKSALRVK